MPNNGFEPSVPEPPRNGQYLKVTGYTETEGGGDLEVRLTQCPDCFAAVAENALEAHENAAHLDAGGPGGPSGPKK